MSTKSSGRRRTTGRGAGINVRVHPDLLSFIDRLRADRDPPVSRPEAIRQALEALRSMKDDARNGSQSR